MPSIPQYQQQVEAQALPGVRQQSIASPDLFAGPNTIGKLGQVIGDVAQKYQDREDTALVNQGETILLSKFNKFKTDSLSRKGLNAGGLVEEADKFASETIEDTVKNAPNARVGDALRAIANKHLPGFQGYIGAHAAAQTQQAVDDEAKANVNAQIDSAITDPRTAPDAANRVTSIIQSQSVAAGQGPEATKLAVQQGLTALHGGVVDQLIQNNKFDDAKAYYFGNKASIDPTKYVAFEKKLELSGRLQETQRGADSLMEQVRAGGLTYSQAEAAAREKFTGEDRNAVISELRNQKSEFDNAHSEAEKAQFAPVNTLIGDYTLKGKSIPKAEMLRVLQPLMVNPDNYAKAAKVLDAHNDEIRGEQNAAADRARSLANNGVDRQLYGLQLKYDMLQHPDKWRNADLTQVLLPMVKDGSMRPTDMDAAIDLQTQMRKPQRTPELATLVSASEYLNNRLETTVVDGKQVSAMARADKDVVKAKALQVLEPLVQEYQARTGEKANTADVKKIVDSIFVDKRYRNTFAGFTYGDVKTETHLDPEGAASRAVPAIPPNLRQRIETALKANGYEVTPENVLEAYQAGKK